MLILLATTMKIERGDIILADLDPAKGHEIQKTRPVIVITNNIANMHSPLVTVIPVTSKRLDRVLRFELLLGKVKGLPKPSKALVQQLRTIDKNRLVSKLGTLSDEAMSELDERLKIHLGLS
jgi:mRNA interferase MazF